MVQVARIPYWRLSGFYFWYFAALGAFLPYWSLYLSDRGYSALRIGALMAVVAGTKVIAPNLWGWAADRRDWDVKLIRWASFGALVFFGLLAVSGEFTWVCWMTFAFSFFWNASLPVFEALTLRHLETRVERYSQVRVWGSVGFIVAVLSVGLVLHSGSLALECLPWVLLALLGLQWLSSLSVPASDYVSRESPGRFAKLVWRREIVAFFIVVMLIQASHGPYYVFFSIHLKDLGLDADRIGLFWVLGVLAEIALFVFAHRLFRRYAVRKLLLVTLALAGVRWLLIGWGADRFAVLSLAQLLHGASFGCTHAVGIQLTQRYFPGRHRNKGQALYSSASFGLGGAIGSWLAGVGWATLGAGAVFSTAAVACFVAWYIAWIWVERSATFDEV